MNLCTHVCVIGQFRAFSFPLVLFQERQRFLRRPEVVWKLTWFDVCGVLLSFWCSFGGAREYVSQKTCVCLLILIDSCMYIWLVGWLIYAVFFLLPPPPLCLRNRKKKKCLTTSVITCHYLYMYVFQFYAWFRPV